MYIYIVLNIEISALKYAVELSRDRIDLTLNRIVGSWKVNTTPTGFIKCY